MSRDDSDTHEIANTDETADTHDMADTHELADIDEVDALFDLLIAGAEPTADGPAWSHDVALLVRAAQAPARPDELAGEDDIVRRMVAVRHAAAAHPGDGGPAAVTAGAVGFGTTVTRLNDRRARPDQDRNYRAKHAAARLEASRHPAVRTVGRVIAMKAAAVTTAAVIGVAAAAAATTGIVATVVVPAFSGDSTPEPDPTPPTTHGRRTEATTGVGARMPDDVPAPAVCPMVPTCTAPPPAAATPATTVTTALTTTPTTADTDDGTAAATTTTVVESTTTTTVSTQTTVETTTTSTTVDPDPGPSTFSDPDPGPSTFSNPGPDPGPSTFSNPGPDPGPSTTSDPGPDAGPSTIPDDRDGNRGDDIP